LAPGKICQECRQSVVVWERGMRVCAHNCINVSSCVLYAYVSFLSAFISILPANLSVSAYVERDQCLFVWVASICPSISFSLCIFLFVCLPSCQSEVCADREKPSLSAEGLPTERSEKPIYLSGYLRLPVD